MINESSEVVVLNEVSQELPEGIRWREDEKRITLLGVFFYICRNVSVLAEL